jgi:adenosine deaminase
MIGIKRTISREFPYKVDKMLTRVELHVHLDGAIRHETVWDLAKQKNIPLPGRGGLPELKDYLVVKAGVSLDDFLSRFDIITKVLRGDLIALERLAYEFVEDSSRQGIAYFEARYCPHLLFPENMDGESSRDWTYKITGAIIKGLERGQVDFKTRGNLIGTCIRNNPEHWYTEMLEITADKQFHGGRLVGIDLAGVAEFVGLGNSTIEVSHDGDKSIQYCKKAAELGIPRTIHAGESGAAGSVTDALDTLYANRIGHGYRIVQDMKVYERVRKEQIHLETCPWSSILTASICPTNTPHPIVRFFRDDFNVSVNTDDPTCTGTQMDDEFRLLYSWGLNEAHFMRASFNAARSAFLPENEKKDLLQSMAKLIGFSL